MIRSMRIPAAGSQVHAKNLAASELQKIVLLHSTGRHVDELFSDYARGRATLPEVRNHLKLLIGDLVDALSAHRACER